MAAIWYRNWNAQQRRDWRRRVKRMATALGTADEPAWRSLYMPTVRITGGTEPCEPGSTLGVRSWRHGVIEVV